MELRLIVLRHRFRLARPLGDGEGFAANWLRGAVGEALHADPQAYEAIFRGGLYRAASPAGMTNAPRPFVLCPNFSLDRVDLETRLLGPHAESVVPAWEEAMVRLATAGLGPERISLKLESSAEPATVCIPFEPDGPCAGARLEFLTPTAWKGADGLAFAPLFARIRDRVLYFAAPGEDKSALCRDLASIAAGVGVGESALIPTEMERRSPRSGARHRMGGVTGWVQFRGELGPLWPLMRAGEWTGVGRHTAWGFGQVRWHKENGPVPGSTRHGPVDGEEKERY